MKNFPRIYSLCTVGLIHHGEYEYLFHPFRTDFIGDSAAGKSMIADLLQLILVGSDKFESATEVTGSEKRTPDGMVLATTDKSGIGYAFLNIEIAPTQYIAVGTALQAGNQRTRAFVAQAGDVFLGNSLKPLLSPLGFSQLIRQDDNAILPLENLSMHLFEQGVTLHPYEYFTDFHDLLIANRLLPLKPTAGQQALKDYATIIRSFARGYKIEAHKSTALQQFLFSRNERDKLLSQVETVQRNIEKNIQSHGHNLEAIENFKQQQTDFKALLQKETEWKQARAAWAKANYHFVCQMLAQCQRSVIDTCQHLNTDFARLAVIRPIINSFQETLPDVAAKAKAVYDDAIITQNDLKKTKQSIDTVQKWLDVIGLGTTLDQLTDKFNTDQKKQAQRQSITYLLDILLQANLTEDFQDSAWTRGYETGYIEYQQKLDELNAQIKEKEQLVLLTNLDDPTSLGYWASHLERSLTLEEESVLRHFQQLPTKKPTSGTDNRFIPSAKSLFDKLAITGDEDIPKTYWANLSGVWEQIQQIQDPLFNTEDKHDLKEKLLRWSGNLQNEIKDISEKRNKHIALRTFLESVLNLNSLLTAYTERTQVEQFKFNSEWEITWGDFQKLVAHYRTSAKTIKNDIEKTDNEVKISYEAFTETNNQANCLESINHLLNDWSLSEAYVDVLSQLLPNRTEFILHTDQLLAKPDIDSNLKTLIDDLTVKNKNQIRIDDWRQSLTSLVQAEQQNRETEKEYLAVYDSLPNYSGEVTQKQLDEFCRTADTAWALYKAEYERLAEHYLPGQKYLVDDSEYKFMTLAYEVLPPPLQKTVQSADEVISAIGAELLRINNQARQIADSIIRKAGEVVAQLGQTIGTHQRVQSDIQKFFKNQTIPITNNCNVRLDWRRGELSVDWISAFADLIDHLDTPLFRRSDSIDVDTLRDKMDVKELIKTAFRQANNGKSLDIKTILDPFAYYELSFGMYYENGLPNKGSTGQTYAALALLNIARLSIIEAGSPDSPAPGLRIMPIDEAEGLGSNFTMLADIAHRYDYQLIAMSIGPVGRYQESTQHVYMLHKDRSTDEAINYPPFAVLSAKDAHLLTYRYNAKN